MQRIVVHLAMLLALLVVLTFPSLGTAKAFTKSMRIPLEALVSVPLSDGSTETVSLSGLIHVVLHLALPEGLAWPPDSTWPTDPIYPSDPMRIAVNLEHVAGVGEVTGLRYVATGADRVTFSSFPPDPVIPLNLEFSLIPLVPPNPIFPADPIIPLDIELLITISLETGEIEVTIGEISVQTPPRHPCHQWALKLTGSARGKSPLSTHHFLPSTRPMYYML